MVTSRTLKGPAAIAAGPTQRQEISMFNHNYMSRNDDRTERERRLEDELEDLRLAEQRRRDEEFEEREAARRESEERAQRHAYHYARTASSWPEALEKQAHLFAREAAHWAEDDPAEPWYRPDTLFGPGAEACRFALQTWREEAARRQPEIDELRARIAAIEAEIRLTVADLVEEENEDDHGWQQVAGALRENDYNAWLNW